MCQRQRRGIAVAVKHSVVIHVGPEQGFKFERPPHSLVGKTNLAADRSMSFSFAQSLDYCFNLISLVEVETGAQGRNDRNSLARLIRRQKFSRQTFGIIR